jgi:hypothetical protein
MKDPDMLLTPILLVGHETQANLTTLMSKRHDVDRLRHKYGIGDERSPRIQRSNLMRG